MAHSRRNPVIFPKRLSWWRSWWLIAALALAVGQPVIGTRLADTLTGFIASLQTTPSALEARRTKGQAVELELWSLRREVERLQEQVTAQGVEGNALASSAGFKCHLLPIIARDPGDWASFAWVEAPQAELAQAWLEAPVVVGDAVVGLVDRAVGRRCRVRLLSDVELSLSVTTAGVTAPEDLEQPSALPPLIGQVRGLGGALWCSSGMLLLGEGYCQGPPRIERGDLFSISAAPQRRFAVGDHLITSGLDGIFPRGLRVGTIGRVESTDSSTLYSFGAISALDLHRVSAVWILVKAEPQGVGESRR